MGLSLGLVCLGATGSTARVLATPTRFSPCVDRDPADFQDETEQLFVIAAARDRKISNLK
jgi:hypothetical protein